MKIDRKNRNIWISFGGMILFTAWVAALAIATDRLVNSFKTDMDLGYGDMAIDEKEFGLK